MHLFFLYSFILLIYFYCTTFVLEMFCPDLHFQFLICSIMFILAESSFHVFGFKKCVSVYVTTNSVGQGVKKRYS